MQQRLSPHSVHSPYCRKEIELALRHNKRIIPLMHVESIDYSIWRARNPDGSNDQWKTYQAEGRHLSEVNMHPEIRKINWVYFREGKDDFETSLANLLEIFDRHRQYVRQHTCFLVKALNWERHHKQSRYLLVGEERQDAIAWLKKRFVDEQAPCTPTDVHCEFITESIKNANNLMTQVFLCYSERDRAIAERIRKALLRESITVWSNTTDIQSGAAWQEMIYRGIEGANTVVYLMSPDSLTSPSCQRELTHAFSLNKRIIPLRLQFTELVSEFSRYPHRGLDDMYNRVSQSEWPSTLPSRLQSIQFIDIHEHSDDTHFRTSLDKLLLELSQDVPYYEQHKQLLVKALKWQSQNRNPSILLRGYNLSQAEAWLKVAQKHGQHLPTALQEEFIAESARQPPNATLDVFISYSRTDSDFARQLNEALQTQGKTTWFDQESIAAGADFQHEIERGIETADNFVFILSPSSVLSPHCEHEVNYAKRLNKRIVPVLHRPVDSSTLPETLATVQWIDFNRQNQDFLANFNELVRTLETDRDYLHQHTKLSLRSLEWQHRGKLPEILLRGAEFAIAQDWLETAIREQKQPPPTELQQLFVRESQWAIDAETKRDKRRILVLRSLVVAMGVALIAAITQWQQARTVQEAQINALSRYSEALRANHQELDALVEAIRAARQSQRQFVQSATQFHVRSVLQEALFQLQEVNQLNGHAVAVASVRFSPDGQALATAGYDGVVKLWSIDGRELATLIGHQGKVHEVTFSPDGQTIATAGSDRFIRLWNRDGTLRQVLQGHLNEVFSVAYSPDGQRLVSGSRDRTLRFWSAQGGLLKTINGHSDRSVRAVAFSPDGQMVASVGTDQTLRLWTPEGVLMQTIEAHQGWMVDVTFSPDGQTLATAGHDNVAHIWTRTGEKILTLTGHGDWLEAIAYSPDGQTIATAGHDQTIRLWNLDGQEIHRIQGHQNSVFDVAFSPEGHLLASGSFDSSARLWRIDPISIRTLRADGALDTLAYSPDGQTIATGSEAGTVSLWNAQGRQLGWFIGHPESQINAVAFSPDGQTLATASNDNTAKLWTLEGGLLATLTGHSSEVQGVAFSPDGQTIATASYDSTVSLWNRTGTRLRTLDGHRDWVYDVAFSPDGEAIATSSLDNTVKIWFFDGRPGLTLPHDLAVFDVAFSPDGQWIATAVDDNTVQLWNRTGQLIQKLPLSDSVASVAFSPDSRLLAGAGWDLQATLWTIDGHKVKTLDGHQGAISQVQFSPDGRLLATASHDGTARLWQLDLARLETTAQLQTLDIADLLKTACRWVSPYLTYSQQLEAEDRRLCYDIAWFSPPPDASRPDLP